MDEKQRKQLNEAGREMWDAKAAFWDGLHGADGNSFHRTLVSPSVEQLLNVQPGERVLDIGCGTGVMARRLAELGAVVMATDYSAAILRIAQERGQPSGEPIDYRRADATDEAALIALGAGQFEAIVCTMAIMDIPDIAPMFRAATKLLTKNGRFVFATTHPAFNSNNPVIFAELADVDGELVQTMGVKISKYVQNETVRGVGARGEPNPHYYYHRPLQTLLSHAFDAGLVLDGLLEPAYPQVDAANADVQLSWAHLWQIAPVLTARLRVMPPA